MSLFATSNIKIMPQMDYEAFITNILSQGRISFTREEILSMSVSSESVKRAISRYTQKGRLYSVRQGFYVIITPEFLHQKRVPELMFIDDLMKYLNSPYYVSLLSAAALHGAGHQQPMTFFVTNSNTKLRNINNERHRINFTLRQQWLPEMVVSLKTRMGYVQVSTPEATMFDLVENQKTLGLGRAIEVIRELTEITKSSKIKEIINYYPIAIRQRLGYILDLIGGDSTVIEKSLKGVKVHPVPFSLAKRRIGGLDDKWKIVMNDTIKIDI